MVIAESLHFSCDARALIGHVESLDAVYVSRAGSAAFPDRLA